MQQDNDLKHRMAEKENNEGVAMIQAKSIPQPV